MKKLLAAVVISFASFTFAAEPELKPAQEEAKDAFDKEVEASVKAMNEKCGTKVTLKTDFHNLDTAKWSGTSISSYCSAIPDTLASMCESRPAYKKAIGKKLTGVSCLFSGVKAKKEGDGTNEATLRNMSFEKGVFTYTMSPVDHANLGDNAKATMEKALN